MNQAGVGLPECSLSMSSGRRGRERSSTGNGGAGLRGRHALVDQSRLSQLTTQWTLIFDACRGPDDAVKAAQAEVLQRYCGAIYRYALRVLGEADLADEVCQEFAFRFVRGDFRNADPARGRFRDYVKTAVIHLMGEVRGREQDRHRAIALESGVAVAVPAPPPVDPENSEFQRLWRKELLNRAWYEMEPPAVGVRAAI